MEFLRFLCKIIYKVFIRVKVFCPEKMPEEGAVIVAPNHETMLDMFMIGYRLKRYVKWISKAENFKFKPFGAILRKLGSFPVRRGEGDVGAASQAINYLNNGEALGIFPQGTRSRGRGLSLKPKSGFLRLALATDAYVVPVAIWGKIRLFGKAYVRFGDPVKAPELIDPGQSKNKEALNAAAEEFMCDRVYGIMEVPDDENN